MNLALAIALAARQGGYATRGQLLDLGYTPSMLRRAVSNGVVAVVAADIYRIVPMEGEESLLAGAILSLPGAVVSHISAARLWQFPYVSKGPPTVSVHHRTTHVFPGVTVRRTLDLDSHHKTEFRGVPITTPARTVSDLAADLHVRHLDAVVDGVLVGRLTDLGQLQRILEETGRRGKPGTVNFRHVLAVRDGAMATATVLERLGHSVLRRHGLPEPIPQYPIPWDPTRRFDGAYPQARLALEWDSRRWHAALEQMAEDRARDRECAVHSWVMLRFTWHDLKQKPVQVAEEVRAILERRLAG